ncbi:OB-fold nucleic acid binding domain-containing protein [Tateyamaria omphalii]|uniref:OB-fold nucleic acid binding domain-containing protein n=1 Tax=Tateyamaria omphalii TaxID=299262 RepID=UPI001672A3E3|nr:OB-fold nucleic acid binding domain-containing protein [Tateyamaria omphalii]
MQTYSSSSSGHTTTWPRPPACLRANELDAPPVNARVAVAGLVILRQRPGTAKGVIFLTLEDETGVVNIIVWRHIYERFRRAVVAGRMLKVTGRMQRAHNVTHVLAEEIEDISSLLDQLLAEGTGRHMRNETRTDTWESRKGG